MKTTLQICSLALVVCLSAGIASAGQKAALDADTRELSTYTLTVETLTRVDRATRAMMTEIKKDPRFIEERKLKAEIETLRGKDEPTEADGQRIEQLEAKLEELEERNSMGMGEAGTIDELAARFQKEPVIVNALSREGLTPREYSKFLLASFQAGIAAAVQKMGAKELPAGTNPANVTFMIEHEAEFKKMQSAWNDRK
jgi:hypothetical protein